jgi:hypothetical protein
MKKTNAGKGSSPRPFSVPLGSFNDNFEIIFGKKLKKCSTCNGSGEVVSYQRDGKTPAYLNECPVCRGFGQI